MSDGQFHSGEELAAASGITRAAVWKRIRQLARYPGIDVDAVRGRGYRLKQSIELLDSQLVLQQIDDARKPYLEELLLFSVLESTNAHLAGISGATNGASIACLAEHQTAGRGRRGKSWVSGYGQNVHLSLLWHFELPLAALSGLSLMTGVVVADVLSQNGLIGHSLKWPNDVHVDGRKLSGILVEAYGEMNGPTRVVIGIGLNRKLPSDQADKIDQPWVDLASIMDTLPSRNRLAGQLLDGLIAGCRQFEQQGIAAFIDAWRQHDRYIGKNVKLLLGQQTIQGQYLGVDNTGGLLLDVDGKQMTYQSGEVSLRLRHE